MVEVQAKTPYVIIKTLVEIESPSPNFLLRRHSLSMLREWNAPTSARGQPSSDGTASLRAN